MLWLCSTWVDFSSLAAAAYGCSADGMTTLRYHYRLCPPRRETIGGLASCRFPPAKREVWLVICVVQPCVVVKLARKNHTYKHIRSGGRILFHGKWFGVKRRRRCTKQASLSAVGCFPSTSGFSVGPCTRTDS
ncbi:hypothetical protein EVAR_66577_1 [Eumeta japonica]|uniref:Secreted protein n=1 Tax=Eumeta variegata TaxID=151549 RepID=A0A4C1Z2C6_EUMVA|nr:hypothetical protein EVAR_66577_1 [Eumeta japonica]